MQTKYFHKIPGDCEPERGMHALNGFYTERNRRCNWLTGERLQQAMFVERVWESWVDDDFIVGPDYIASWQDRSMGFAMHKVWSPNVFLDRCVIENPDDEDSYVLFDLVSKRAYSQWQFLVYDLHEYRFTSEDETLIRLAI